MVDTPTSDPNIIIEDQSTDNNDPNDDWVIYKNLKSKYRWIIRGRCNRCGLCEVGRVDDGKITFDELIKIGEAEACIDLTFKSRLDVPSTPDVKQNADDQREAMKLRGDKNVSETGECTLSGEYI